MKKILCRVGRTFLRRRYHTLLIFSAVVFFAACSANPSSVSTIPGTVDENTKNPLSDLSVAATAGRSLFSIHCAMCHGDDGKGQGMAGGSLGKTPTDLTAGNVNSDPDGKLFLAIKNGIKKDGKQTMPPAKEVTDEQIWQIVTYMRSLARK